MSGGCHDTRSSINAPHGRVLILDPSTRRRRCNLSRSPLRPTRKSFAFALRTAAVPPGRRIGTRECSNVKPLRLRDTALATLDGVCYNSDAAHRYRFATHSFNGWRCCPIPPLYKVLLGRAFSLRYPLRAGALLSSPSFPHCGALALFALRQS